MCAFTSNALTYFHDSSFIDTMAIVLAILDTPPTQPAATQPLLPPPKP